MAFRVLIFSFFIASYSFAAQEITAVEQIKVYKSPNVQSRILGNLKAGRKFKVADKPYGEFRKVLIVTSTKHIIGFIRDVDYRNILDPKAKEASKRELPLLDEDGS